MYRYAATSVQMVRAASFGRVGSWELGIDDDAKTMTSRRTPLIIVLSVAAFSALQAFQNQPAWPPAVRKTPEKAPVLSAEEELKTLALPPGYHAQLVAKEPLVIDPIAIDFDADGRMWVLEMPGFMSEPAAANSREPINTVAVLEDQNGDGIMDKRTVFADKLVLPRAIKVLDTGVLVGEPPNLWFMKDTNGDLVADTKDLVSSTYGRAAASIEHNANSLFWGLDNVIYTSEHDWHLRLKNGAFETIPTLARGQWGASMDDAGRIYRNVNDAPLFVDLVASKYYARNPNLVRTRGLYDPLISREASTIWPARPTRGVNRGYRDQFFRPDDSSVTIQGVGTPVIYRGDRLPTELYGDAFITDSTTNLVHRYKIRDDGTGRLKAVDGYAKGEILASWDERFRPVNMLGGPDGTLYVVDMYRGVVREAIYWTDFLRDYIRTRDLEKPIHNGRIWRIVHDTTRRDRKPALSKAAPAELVNALAHPNGWWRDTAQQLLVQRGDKSVVPQLKQLATETSDWRVKLHALWTLDGLDAIEAEDVLRALADKSADVRASAIRLAEPWVRQPDHPLAAAVLKLSGDPSWTVRRQLAATIGELPRPARTDPVVTMLTRYGGDPITVDATISGLAGSETDVLKRVMRAQPAARETDPVSMLAAAIARSGDSAGVQQLLGRIADVGTPPAQRMALLQGLDLGLPGGSGGRGARGGGGGRGLTTPAKPVALPAEPAELERLAAAPGDTGIVAKRVVARLEWPNKPARVVEATPLTAEEQQRFTAGAEVYKNVCVGCHQPDGRGKEKIAPSLIESRYTTGLDANVAARILLAGKEGSVGLMPPLGGALSDEQIAAVLTYVRREWGNTGSPVSEDDVTEVRGLTKTRTRPWTDAELASVGRGRGRGF
jgi:mono/diheme cytochrome c family protein/glucose/arabinose dehydrogenase